MRRGYDEGRWHRTRPPDSQRRSDSSEPAVASDSLARRLTVPPPPTSFATSPHPTYPTRPQNQLAQAARAWRRPQSALSQLWRVCGRHGACVANTSCVPPLAPHTFPFSQTPTVAASSLVRAPPPPAHFYLRLLSASRWGYLSVAAAVRSRRRRCRAQQGLRHGFQSRFSIPPRHSLCRRATR